MPPACLRRLTEISAAVADITGQPQVPSQPFVGANAFAHKGGIHVAALRKMPESYNHCDPSLVGNAMRSVVSDLSGRGNILDKAEKAGLLLGRDDAGAVLAHIKHLESEGCAFESASASVDMLIVRRGSAYVQPFQVNHGALVCLLLSGSSLSLAREPDRPAYVHPSWVKSGQSCACSCLVLWPTQSLCVSALRACSAHCATRL